ncbi:Glutathione S-transferase, N-terminal domain containing protein [Amanita muscaria]
MSTQLDTGKTYTTSSDGEALKTVDSHLADAPYTLFASWFCPFVQRAWVALENLEIPYTVNEVDPYRKPADLIEVSPKGLVPALKLNEYTPPRSLNESTIIVEFLDELARQQGKGRSLLPPLNNPYARALIRLQVDHINRTLVPSFYRYLQAQDADKQTSGHHELYQALETLASLFERAERELGTDKNVRKYLGLWVEDGELSLADVMVVPWILRATNALKHYRGFELPTGDKFDAWVHRLFNNPSVKATCSTDQLYINAYERYAFNRPNTSQVANAINTGKGLP